jgi:mannose-binding lectin 1
MKIHSLLSIVPLLLAVCEAGIFSSSKEQDSSINDAPPTFRYDYKLAFKKPYYYNDSVPFWETGGGKVLIGTCCSWLMTCIAVH